MTQAPILALAGFGVAFGDRVVLRGVDLEVPATGCTVILGPSGTGKSTLLRTLAGANHASLTLRTWGRADYCGSPCDGGHRPALVAQNSRLLVSNVLENLVCELPGRAELTQRVQAVRVEALLHEFGCEYLLGRLRDKVVEQSLADQATIAILRRVIALPAVLMLDEPTTGLPEEAVPALLALIRKVAERRAVVIVLHHLQQARWLGGQAVLMADGVVQEARSMEDFFERPRTEQARMFIATGSCPEQARSEVNVLAGGVPMALPRVPPPTAAPSLTAVSASRGPRGFKWLFPGEVAGTPWPGIVHGVRYDLDALRNVGVTRLVSLTEVPFSPVLAADFGIDCSSVPVIDMEPPSVEQALLLCESIERELASGQVVAVHCRAGLGRTGTVLAAYWLWRKGGKATGAQAVRHLRQIEAGFIQSESQVRFLEEFALVVADKDAGKCITHDPETVADDASSAIHCPTLTIEGN